MSVIEIDTIKTGRGFVSSRIGKIYAPKDAPAGSLAELVRFFQEETDIAVRPGYDGPNKNHILRLSGLPETDDAFLKLLQKKFPVWLAKQPDAPHIHFADELSCGQVDEPDHFPHQSEWKKFIKEKANTLTGVGYMAGSLGLMLAAWRQPKRMPGKPAHDWLRGYTASAYFTASAILVAMSRSTDNPRSIHNILEEIYPPMASADQATQDAAYETTESVMSFLQKYPWETSMILNASGAGAHALSCARRGDMAELIGALASTTGCFLSSVIPEKGGRSMIPVGEWLESQDGRSMYDRIEDFADAHPNTAGWMKQVNRTYDWIENNPLRAASTVQIPGNLAYATAGIRAQNYPLTFMSAAFLAGNYTQSQATKGRGDSFDSVVTAAANIITADPLLNKNDRSEVRRKIKKLANRLSHEQEVVHSEARIEKGIVARLEAETAQDDDMFAAFMPSEKQYLMTSPFTDNSHVSRILGSDSESATTTSIR